jgi:phosphatidylglycerophosphatase A
MLHMVEQRISFTILKHPVHFLALGCGSGCVPKLPGTAGTLVGVLFYLPLQTLFWPIYVGIVLLLFLMGIWLCGKTAKHLGVHDHPAIVWDEIVGYLVTMILVPSGWQWLVAGFALFRLFDIWKPWPIHWIDKKVKGGFGIMLDDVIAGIYALLILQIIAYLL